MPPLYGFQWLDPDTRYAIWLDMPHIVWHDAAMKAQRIFYHKELMFDGVIEMVIWQLPMPTKERPHGLKYRLVYAVHEERVVGYVNETGKGGHKHLHGRELPYRFVDVDTLVADFYRDVRSCK